MNIVYLHGFGSSAKSAKAAAIRRNLGADCRRFDVPTLDGNDFYHLTMDVMAERAVAAVQQAAASGPVLVIGSSLGGYLAAWLAAEGRLPGLQALVLIAPAFRFPARWRERLGDEGIATWRTEGQRLFFHYGEERDLPLGVAFLDSCLSLPDIPGPSGVLTSVIHGRHDESVDWRASRDYSEAHERVELHVVEGGHALDQPRDEALITVLVRNAVLSRP